MLSPLLRLEWHHEFEDDPIILTANYATEGATPAPGWDRWMSLVDVDYRKAGWSIDGVENSNDGSDPRLEANESRALRAARWIQDMSVNVFSPRWLFHFVHVLYFWISRRSC